MDTFEKVVNILKECLQKASSEYFRYDYLLFLAEKELSSRVSETISNWITDPIKSSIKIMYLIEDFLPGLKGFRKKKYLQKFVAFICLQAIMNKAPVIDGFLEKVIFVIINHCKQMKNDQINNVDESDQTMLKETVKSIQELCSPKRCPNPCLRLELISLAKHFSPDSLFAEVYDDLDPFREIIINTICDITDKYSHLTIDEIQMPAIDLVKIVEDSSLDIRSIMQKVHPESKRIKIIGSMLQLTKMFALLEKESPVRVNRGLTDKEDGLHECVNFCGLIPEYDRNLKSQIPYFTKVISDQPLLLDYLIEAYNAIYDASKYLLGDLYDEEGKPNHNVTALRDIILMMFFKQYIGMSPVHQLKKEIHGGISQSFEHRIRLFSNYFKVFNIELYNDYDTPLTDDSEEDSYSDIDSNESGYIIPESNDPEDNNSEYDDFEELDSEGIVSEEDDF